MLLSLPAFAVLMLVLLIECRRKERPDAKTGGLPVMVLLLVPLAAGTILLYYLTAFWLSFQLHLGSKAAELTAMLAGLVPVVLAEVLIEQIAARLLRLNRKNRIISALLMMLLTVFGSIGFAVHISLP